MSDRTVTDSAGRTWTCSSANAVDGSAAAHGNDVMVSCSTPSVDGNVTLTVGWQWEKMSSPGFARLITQQSPVPRR